MGTFEATVPSLYLRMPYKGRSTASASPTSQLISGPPLVLIALSAFGRLELLVVSLARMLDHFEVTGRVRRTQHLGAIGALIKIVQQPRTLLVRGRNAGMSTTGGADELVKIP